MPWETLVLFFFFLFPPPFLVFAETAFFPVRGRKVNNKLFTGLVPLPLLPCFVRAVEDGGRDSDFLDEKPYPRGLFSNIASNVRAARFTGDWSSLITFAMTAQKFLPNRSKHLG